LADLAAVRSSNALALVHASTGAFSYVFASFASISRIALTDTSFAVALATCGAAVVRARTQLAARAVKAVLTQAAAALTDSRWSIAIARTKVLAGRAGEVCLALAFTGPYIAGAVVATFDVTLAANQIARSALKATVAEALGIVVFSNTALTMAGAGLVCVHARADGGLAQVALEVDVASAGTIRGEDAMTTANLLNTVAATISRVTFAADSRANTFTAAMVWAQLYRAVFTRKALRTIANGVV